jgi:hypothetical protein
VAKDDDALGRSIATRRVKRVRSFNKAIAQFGAVR